MEKPNQKSKYTTGYQILKPKTIIGGQEMKYSIPLIGKWFLSIIFAFILSNAGFATIYYSKTSGDPAVLTNWTDNTAGTGASPGAFSAADTYIIQSGHTMTMASAWSPLGTVQVNASGTLATGNNTLTLTGNTSAYELDVAGTFIQGKNMTLTSTPALRFQAGSTYQLAMNGGTIPASTFDASSTMLITGATTTAPTFTNTSFGNLTWNSAMTTNSTMTGITVAGTFNVANTSTGNVNLNNCTIKDWTQTAGKTALTTAGSSISGNMSVTGTATFTNGGLPLTFNGTSQTISGNALSLAGLVTSNATVLTSTNAITATSVTIGSGTSYTPSGTLTDNGPLTVAGTLNLSGTNSITGAVSNTGTINLGTSATTMASTVTNTGTINFGTSSTTIGGDINNTGGTFVPGTSNVTLNKASSQAITGATTFNNLTTNSTGTTLGSNMIVNGLLTLGSSITLGSANLIMGSSASAIAGTSATKYIIQNGTGILHKTFGATGSYTYPIGDATNYTPITSASVTGSSWGGTVGFSTIAGKNANIPSTTDYINRYWALTTSGITGASVSGTATFIGSEIVGTAANIYGGVNNSNTPTGWVKGSAISGSTLGFSGWTTSSGIIGGIDGRAPLLTAITPSVATITDANVGSNTFSLTLTFDEDMDQTVNPTISFPTGGENPSGVITLGSGSVWIDSKHFKANYNVTDNNLKMSAIDVNGVTAQDVMKNVMVSTTLANIFSYDMSNPTATITSNLSTLKDANVGTGTFTITVTFSEAMTTTIAPTISFPVESPGLALTFNSGAWSGGNTIYTATYNVFDINNDVLNIDVSASGSQNPNGNTMTPKTQADLFSILMKNPTLSPVTIASNNSNSTAVAKSGDQIKVLFTASETLGALPTASIDGQTAAVSLISGLNYQATLTMAAYPEGTVPIVINFTDVSGNTASVTATTDGSAVVYDRTAPINQNSVYGTGGTTLGGKTIPINASLNATDKIWFAPAGLTTEGAFAAGATMTKASSGSATSILAPATAGSYRLYVIDLAGNVSAASTAILVVDNTPILAATEAGPQIYTENGGAVAVTSTTTVDDDGANMTGATIQITGNYSNGNDVLTYSTTAGVTGIWNVATGTMTLSGTAPLASYQAAIRAVMFSNTSDNPSLLTRTVSIRATDASSTNSNTVTRAIDLIPVNDPPAFTTSPILNVVATNLYVYDMDAIDPDNALAYANFSYTTGPAWLALSNAGAGKARLSGTPPVGVSGPFNVTLTCSDGSGGSVTQSYVINVTGAAIVDATGAGTHLTLQAAVDAAAVGSKIIVNPGTYIENVVINKSLDIAGTAAASCIFDGNCAGSVIKVLSGTVTFSNITVQNGCGTFAVQADAHGPQAYYGGGFYITGSPVVTMTGVVIKSNKVSKYGPIGGNGGGMYIGNGANVTLNSTSITGNTSELYRGAGICIERSTLTLNAGTSITGNGGCNYGGGIFAWSSTITNNITISGNSNSGPNSYGSDIFALKTTFTPALGGASAGNYHIAP